MVVAAVRSRSSSSNLFGLFLTSKRFESSIAVEDAVENRGLYRVFVSRLF